MSNAMKIKGTGSKTNKQPPVSQSIPVQWYANYVPPAAPKIKPSHAPPVDKLPNFDLPPSSPDNQGITALRSFSLQNDAHPMSMPVHRMTSDTLAQRLNAAKAKAALNQQKKQQMTIDEHKDNTNSLSTQMKKLEVGSFTCFELMTGSNAPNRAPLQPLSQTQDTDDLHTNVSETPSTVQTQSRHEDDEEDAPFEMSDDDEEESD